MNASRPTATSDWPAARRAVLTRAASIGVAVGTYGVSFGALAVTAGFSVPQTLALSLLTFTGGSQFALVGVVASGGSPVAGTLAALFLGLRNALYGLTVAPLLRVSGARRLLAAHLVIDETTAVAISQPDGRASRLGFWSTGVAVFSCWNLATLAGALTVSAIGDPRAFGLDAAVGAGLLALVWPRLVDRSARFAAVGAAVLALALTPLLPPGVPVLLAASVAIVLAWPAPRPAQRHPPSGKEVL